MTAEDDGTSEESDVCKLFHLVHVTVYGQHALLHQLARQQILQRGRAVSHIRTKVHKQKYVSVQVITQHAHDRFQNPLFEIVAPPPLT